MYITYSRYPDCDIKHGKGELQPLWRYSFIGAEFIEMNKYIYK